jgi:hypothetical protein
MPTQSASHCKTQRVTSSPYLIVLSEFTLQHGTYFHFVAREYLQALTACLRNIRDKLGQEFTVRCHEIETSNSRAGKMVSAFDSETEPHLFLLTRLVFLVSKKEPA